MTDINAHLIGIPGGRARLNTPALILDLDALEANIEALAARAKTSGIALRPHAKTHKSAEIARRQVAAGALGVCCAKLAEAEALTDAGITNILITSPVVTEEALKRLARLNARTQGLMAVVDDARVLERMGEAIRAQGSKRLTLLMDLDIGLHRTGIAPGEAAYRLAAAIAAHPALDFKGLQAYAGHVMHIENEAARREKSKEGLAQLRAVRDELTRRNLAPEILSGGGTGTFDIDPAENVFTELQAGSYVFMDRQYNDVWTKDGKSPPFAPSLFIETSVISANTAGIVTTDAGLKCFATEAGSPQIIAGAPEGAAYFFFGDEQGGILFANPGETLAPGRVVTCLTPHCDPTVNLHDVYHVVRGDTLIAIWPVDARGRCA
ncbi:MAG: DSD1 family PLP-dependent enzyme [Alphaproteobacteria bacterium]|nr:DSD1 family PLP-dependent enzyme [Alphaproteobacteria bacterium]